MSIVKIKKIKVYTETDSLYTEKSFEKLHSNLIKDINELGIPGLQVSIIKNGKQYDFSLGTIDYDRQHKITNKHILRIGSVTKIYTSAIIMKLVENGELSLDDTLDIWYPEIPNSDKITIKNLLNHTSGIYNYTENLSFQLKTVLLKNKFWKPEEIYKYILKGTPYFNPNENQYYSNSNYLLLGLIAEEVTGKKYSELLDETIIKPLNLKNTFFLPYDSRPKLLIKGYDRDVIPLGIHEINPENTVWASSAYSAGAIASNTKDIIGFVEALFTNKIIANETLQEMMSFENFLDEDIPEQVGYGLGLRKLKLGEDILIGHTGTIPGFGGAAFYCPDKDYYIVLLGNISYLNQSKLLKTIIMSIEEIKQSDK